MKRRVDIETSVVSYLAGRPSRDLIVAGRQHLTHTWWEERRPDFDLVISQVVLDEVGAGDPSAARRRLAYIEGLPLLEVTTEAAELAATLIERVPLPSQAAADAAHMAVATFHGVDFLMTWNVAHIANATLRRRVEDVCRAPRFSAPILCTPDELMGMPMNEVLEQHGPWQDPIVAEVRAVRSALFAASGNDIREFCRRARERQAVSGHVILMRASEPDREPTRTESPSHLSAAIISAASVSMPLARVGPNPASTC